jgi:tyrosine-protein phosphatase YwqE
MGLLDRLFGVSKLDAMPLKWDMHNHILFGIDDGSKSLEYSIEMAKNFIDLGYERIIATPHIMSDYYPNNRAIIEDKKNKLEHALAENHLNLKIDFAAEYYMDEVFYELIKTRGDVLPFHGQHVLVETSFMNKPVFFDQLLFEVKTAGYMPVLAHPERYIYLQDNYEEAERILDTGIKFQINLMSLAAYYSPMAKKFSQWLIKNGYYHFLGTDAHSNNHLKVVKDVLGSKLFAQIDFSKVENAQ